ncbi:MAG TPA: hypothetical protein VF599_03875 [Pyrinomonadaceae bacterium]|jgi:hypothetical protein
MKMILFLLLATCFGFAACTNMENPALTAENRNVGNETSPIVMDKTPVLVELFTSEG